MTLPKNITDAIDTLLQRACKTLTSSYAMPADEYLRICTEPDRAALEAAILAHIQPAPAEPPSDAEVEAWEREARKVDLSVCSECPGELYEIRGDHLAKGLAIMRRARATGSLERLRERVEAEVAKIRNALSCERNFGMAKALDEVLGWIDEERGAGR